MGWLTLVDMGRLATVGCAAAALMLAIAGCGGNEESGETIEPRLIRVPAIAGKPVSEAKALLASAGLRAERPLSQELCETPGAGELVREQYPRPSTRLAAGRSVEFYTRCVIRPCRPSELALSIGGEPGLLAGGATIGVVIEHRRDSACQLPSPLEVDVVGSDGLPVPSMKPFSRAVPFRLGRRGQVSADIAWPRWCGGRERVRLVARIAGTTATGTMEPPVCDGATTSSLYPLRQAFGRWLYGIHQADEVE